MTSAADFKLAGAAAGFTLGFGLLTVWEAIKQTKVVRSPLRSHYIYMIWGEIFVNLVMGIIAWLMLDGVLIPTVPVLFVALLLWVFEIQLLMQIIINRVAVIADDPRMIKKIKWGTVIVISLIQMAVFCIWIPTHSFPPPSPIFGRINKYWDPTSKSLICVIDAALNYYFIRSVNLRLVKFHGLVKYKPLVTFNSRLLVVSVLMDVMLIGLMFLKNGMVYTQFHPVAYMVKLNIEMTMASLIKKIAQASISEREGRSMGYSNEYGDHGGSHNHTHTGNRAIKSGNHTFASAQGRPDVDIQLVDRHIYTKTTVKVTDENFSSSDGESPVKARSVHDGFDWRPHELVGAPTRQSDELPLQHP